MAAICERLAQLLRPRLPSTTLPCADGRSTRRRASSSTAYGFNRAYDDVLSVWPTKTSKFPSSLYYHQTTIQATLIETAAWDLQPLYGRSTTPRLSDGPRNTYGSDTGSQAKIQAPHDEVAAPCAIIAEHNAQLSVPDGGLLYRPDEVVNPTDVEATQKSPLFDQRSINFTTEICAPAGLATHPPSPTNTSATAGANCLEPAGRLATPASQTSVGLPLEQTGFHGGSQDKYVIDKYSADDFLFATIGLDLGRDIIITTDQIVIAHSAAGTFVDAISDKLSFSVSEGHMAPLLGDLGNLLIRVAKGCNVFPSAFMRTGVQLQSEQLVAGGGFADIYLGTMNGHLVALKCSRTFGTKQTNGWIFTEAIVWHSLDHPHVLRFLGLYDGPSRLYMISPWMKNGHIRTYAERLNLTFSCLIPLLLQVIGGLIYLHSHGVIHGDLKSENILINDDGQACLADFGLSSFTAGTGSATPTSGQGSYRFNAPELFKPSSVRTVESDIYAFGCVCLELFTRQPPFPHIREEGVFYHVIFDNGRPARPAIVEDPTHHELWSIVERCWQRNPEDRPSLFELRDALLALI